MSERDDLYQSFLGTGWSFPPRFAGGGVCMVSDEEDIHESLRILFGTVSGERLFAPKYGLDMHDRLFEPVSTSMRTLLLDRVRTALLVYEPRILILGLAVDSPDPDSGRLEIRLDYQVRATNSRFNLVYPFYKTDGNVVRGAVGAAGGG